MNITIRTKVYSIPVKVLLIVLATSTGFKITVKEAKAISIIPVKGQAIKQVMQRLPGSTLDKDTITLKANLEGIELKGDLEIAA